MWYDKAIIIKLSAWSNNYSSEPCKQQLLDTCDYKAWFSLAVK